MNQIITIMPDFGDSPYAWLKSGNDNCSLRVGALVGSRTVQLSSTIPIDHSLEDELIKWSSCFSKHTDASAKEFWDDFHKKGLALTRELSKAVGDNYKVNYVKPIEDNYSSLPVLTEIK